jgi:hypothetical protein
MTMRRRKRKEWLMWKIEKEYKHGSKKEKRRTKLEKKMIMYIERNEMRIKKKRRRRNDEEISVELQSSLKMMKWLRSDIGPMAKARKQKGK